MCEFGVWVGGEMGGGGNGRRECEILIGKAGWGVGGGGSAARSGS